MVIQPDTSKDTFQQSAMASNMQRTNSFLFVCGLCGYRVIRRCYLRLHMLEEHKIDWRSKELINGLVKPRKQLISKGLRSTRSDDDTSDSENASTLRVKFRYKRVPLGVNKKFQCAICSREIDGPHNFYSHYRDHAQVLSYSCLDCEYSSESKISVLEHIRTQHHINLKLTDYEEDSEKNEDSIQLIEDEDIDFKAEVPEVTHIKEEDEVDNSVSADQNGKLMDHDDEFDEITDVELEKKLKCIKDTINYTCKYCQEPLTYENFDWYTRVQIGFTKYACSKCNYQVVTGHLLHDNAPSPTVVLEQKPAEHAETSETDRENEQIEETKPLFEATEPTVQETPREVELFSCSICSHEAKTIQLISKHMEMCHNIKVPLRKESDDVGGASSQNDNSTQQGPQVFSCSTCGHKTKTQMLLNWHMKMCSVVKAADNSEAKKTRESHGKIKRKKDEREPLL